MLKFDPALVKEAARDFARSSVAQHWTMFGSTVQNALLDQHVMNLLRVSYSADSTRTWTAEEIIVFRSELASMLAIGIKLPGGRMVRYATDDQP
jgi:type II secretory pathway component PulF